MTDKQKRFCDEYLIDCNATRAYKVAYPNVKKDETAKAAASRMLTNVNVKNYIDAELQKIADAKIADAKEVMEYLTSVLRGEAMSSEIVIEGIGEGCSEAREMKKEPSEKDKLKAAELLGKRYGMWKDKVELSGIDDEKSKLDDILNQMRNSKE
ncbi:MAG: terminase small subunit [Lachnospiraceae bacterium]|nr:terminase small subunit [Lachnospiraceae bacterium]